MNAGDSRPAGFLRQKEALNDSIFVSKTVEWSFMLGRRQKSMEHDEGRGGGSEDVAIISFSISGYFGRGYHI